MITILPRRCSFLAAFFLTLLALSCHSQLLDVNSLLRRPFQTQCDLAAAEEPALSDATLTNIDQIDEECLLPFASASSNTGCVCHNQTTTTTTTTSQRRQQQRRIECIYANKVRHLPTLVLPLFNSNDNESTQTAWSVEVRCRNMSTLADLAPFVGVNFIDKLDLSSSPAQRQCQIYDDKLKSARPVGKHDRLAVLRQVGQPPPPPPPVGRPPLALALNLSIDQLVLTSNAISRLHLTPSGLGVSTRSLTIRSLHLSRNRLDGSLTMRTHVDACALAIEHLDVSHNQLRSIDVSLLVVLVTLNVSYNRLATFDVDALLDERCVAPTTRDQRGAFRFVSRLTSLDLSHNQLTDLPFTYLTAGYAQISGGGNSSAANQPPPPFAALRKLDASHNKLSGRLQSGQLATMTGLSWLSLSDNKFEHVDRHTFSPLRQLAYLDLSANAIRSLPDMLFADTPASSLVFTNISFSGASSRLEMLDLSDNELSEVPRRTLRHCKHVKSLHLAHNAIRQLHNHSFGFMASLLELNLANNLIERIEPHAFTIDDQALLGPGLVEKLDLSHNRLGHLDAATFAYLTNLRHLILKNNQIRHLEVGFLHGVNHLITLDLSLNMLSEINSFLKPSDGAAADETANMTKLRYLRLSNNQIDGTLVANQFEQLRSIRVIDLSSNRLTGFDDCAFNGIQSSVRKIALSYNRIEHINACSFASFVFRHVRIVQLAHNPIDCARDCDFLFATFNAPHAIDYVGLECLNSTLSIAKSPAAAKVKATNSTGVAATQPPIGECSAARYAEMRVECQRRLVSKACPPVVQLASSKEIRSIIFEHDTASSSSSQEEDAKEISDANSDNNDDDDDDAALIVQEPLVVRQEDTSLTLGSVESAAATISWQFSQVTVSIFSFVSSCVCFVLFVYAAY